VLGIQPYCCLIQHAVSPYLGEVVAILHVPEYGAR
jgi:hypothetical protein